MTPERPRFPIGLTLAAAVAFALCCGLGAWQMQRLGWKHQELVRITALRNAPPQPIGPVLARAAQGQPVEFTRVAADCAPGPPPPPAYHLTTDNGQWIARAFAPCRLAGGAYDGVVVDRGYLSASRGSTATPATALPPPVHVTGVLFVRRDDLPTGGLAHPAPVMISVEHETPAPPGVVAAPYDPSATGDLQYVGAYGPTWFGLAGVLACFYAAMLWRRNHPEKR